MRVVEMCFLWLPENKITFSLNACLLSTHSPVSPPPRLKHVTWIFLLSQVEGGAFCGSSASGPDPGSTWPPQVNVSMVLR